MVAIGIVGASGRLGKQIDLNSTIYPVKVVSRVFRDKTVEESIPEVVIDVSSRLALPRSIEKCQRSNSALIVGVSGLTSEDKELIKSASNEIGIMVAPNFSLGHFLQKKISRILAEGIAKYYKVDITVIDRHPKTKLDTPSSTAVMLSNEFSNIENVDSAIQCLRYGHAVADHKIKFDFEMESIELEHSVFHRSVPANGALMAAIWMGNRRIKGLYAIDDMYNEVFLTI